MLHFVHFTGLCVFLFSYAGQPQAGAGDGQPNPGAPGAPQPPAVAVAIPGGAGPVAGY